MKLYVKQFYSIDLYYQFQLPTNSIVRKTKHYCTLLLNSDIGAVVRVYAEKVVLHYHQKYSSSHLEIRILS